MSIEVKQVSKRFKDFVALQDISLHVNSGELVALLGPSGSGKTTLLRIIAGLEQADTGSILMHGQETQSKHVAERQVGFVFQHYALFKHMTVFENVAFGLRVRPVSSRPRRDQIRKRVMELLHLLHLEQFYDRYPGQLSGGQRQRVALARALAVDPKVLLLDEPFGALDAKVRKELRRWLRRLHATLPVTTLFVTHDQEEAMEVADRVVVMSAGRIEQVGTPEQVYHRPTNSFVYDFLGNYNTLPGWLDASDGVHLVEYEEIEPLPPTPPETPWLPRYPRLRRLLGWLWSPFVQPPPDAQPLVRQFKEIRGEGPSIQLFARPHEMMITKSKVDNRHCLTATIVHINPAGPLVKIELERVNTNPLQVEMSKEIVDELKLHPHDTVYVYPRSMRVFES
jgi:sulfate transport system ATP-binding protein